MSLPRSSMATAQTRWGLDGPTQLLSRCSIPCPVMAATSCASFLAQAISIRLQSQIVIWYLVALTARANRSALPLHYYANKTETLFIAAHYYLRSRADLRASFGLPKKERQSGDHSSKRRR